MGACGSGAGATVGLTCADATAPKASDNAINNRIFLQVLLISLLPNSTVSCVADGHTVIDQTLRAKTNGRQ